MSQEFLQDVYANAEMGRNGLKDIIEKTEDRTFRRVLAEQYAGYQEVMNEVRARLGKQGETPKEQDGAERFFGRHWNHFMLMRNDSTQVMAKLVIDGTKKSGESLERIMGNSGGDDGVFELCAKLKSAQEKSMEQMKRFLQ